MTDAALRAVTIELIRGVLSLIGTARDDMRYRQRAQSVLRLCEVVLQTQSAEAEESAAVTVTRIGSSDLGRRIGELAAQGEGVRQIARRLGVNASTVSRRLTRARVASTRALRVLQNGE